MNQTEISTGDTNSKPARTGSISSVPEWITETINGGSFPVVDLNTGSNGWASPPGGDYLLSPAGVDWLKSTSKLDNVLARPDNRVAQALRKAQSGGESLNSFIFAVNFQVPSKEPHSLVVYFATEDPIPSDYQLHRLINGEEDDESFCKQRLKALTNVVKGPRIVRTVARNFGALRCSYHRGSNYFEIDVDLGSYAIIAALVRLTLGYLTSLTTDVGFVVEKLIGVVRICQMELSSMMIRSLSRREE